MIHHIFFQHASRGRKLGDIREYHPSHIPLFKAHVHIKNSIQDERALFCGCYRLREVFVFP